MNIAKCFSSYIIVFLLFLVAQGQSIETFGDKLTGVIRKELPELTNIKPFLIQPYFRSTFPRIESEWRAKDARKILITCSIVEVISDINKEKSLKKYVFRNMIPPHRFVDGIGDKAMLVSRYDTVEIRFYKENLVCNSDLEFPAKLKVGFYGPAPKEEEEKALRIAQTIAKSIDKQMHFSPCYNDFQKPPVLVEKTLEDKLFAAIIRAEPAQFRKLAKNSIDFEAVLASSPYVKSASHDGNKLLHVAVNQGCVEIIKTLLAANANINARNFLGETPLMLAAQAGNVEIVRLLLNSGANVTLKNKHNGENAAFYALKIHYPYSSNKLPEPRIEILTLLGNSGLDLKEKEEKYGNTLLLSLGCGIYGWCPTLTEYFLNQGIEINIPNNEGRTALSNAVDLAISRDIPRKTVINYDDVLFGYTSILADPLESMRVLLAKGANRNIPYDNRGKSLVDYVTEKRNAVHPSDIDYLKRLEEVIKTLNADEERK